MDTSMAIEILQAGKAEAQAVGAAVSIVAVDQWGDLVALLRDDRALRHTTELARGKAMVSAMLQIPSRDAAVKADEPISRRLDRLCDDALVFAIGAVPIFQDGACIGAVGVSGAPADVDERIAAAAAGSTPR